MKNKYYCLCFLLLSSCSYGTFFVPKQTKVYAPTEPSTIILSSQQDLNFSYKRLGHVAIIVWGNGEKAKKHLQKQAAKVGANAIIQVQIERAFFRTAANGVAVRIFTE